MDTRKIASSTETAEALVITRVFDAPREVVWKVWTDPELLKRWWGATGFTAPVYNIDFRVGGRYFYDMRSPEGQDVWGTGTYREIVPLERIVATDSFADEHGNIVPASHYGMGTLPEELLWTVTFEEVEGKTRLTLRHVGLPSGQDQDLTREGWDSSFDKLAELLKELVMEPA
jgi:uncharacterized protein YndB with AHSA1/START domain